jgi:lysophospholipase L1-like esterase
MQFHTEITPESLLCRIGLEDRIVTVGSCFADVVGQHLADHKLTVLANPFGTVFNPVSIAKLLTMALRGQSPDERLYLERDGLWFHYDFHSSLWATSQDELRATLTAKLADVDAAIRQADWLFITLGTAVVYRHIETSAVVANCHKTPACQFEKYLYQTDHVRADLKKLLKTLHRANPDLRVLLTVSPVRHVRDGLSLNGVSKAILRAVCHELTVWHGWVSYFPAYEIMQDDLRDYRFYEADLIHPNSQAHEYIFGKFADCAFSPELRCFVAEWSAIRRDLQHRPLHGMTDSYQKFLQNLLTKLEALQPRTDVSAELATVKSRLFNYV